MYLKQIELENFKSFGKRLVVPLLSGYTAITGPNGSGKSNISDAILFVLGPKSSRAIRAGKLTDLIFNGGNKKEPAGHTKVSLVFDNADRMIPIDADLVKLTRVVKLSIDGEGYNSYFYVNDRKSSLGEFDLLLSNARISADGYNFVQQGDITKIVTTSNLERRRILDDISGITKYDEEITKAENERRGAEENIERIAIILDELKKQLDQLEAEKESALKYTRTKEKLILAKAQMAYKRKESAEVEIQSVMGQVEINEKEIEMLKKRKDEIATLLQEVQGKIEKAEKDLEARGGEEFKELKEKIDAAKVEVARSVDQMAHAKESISEIEETTRAKTEERRVAKVELDGLEIKFNEIVTAHTDKSNSLSSKKKELEMLQSKISASDDEIADLEKDVTKLDTLVREEEDGGHRIVLDKERAVDRKDRLTLDIANLGEEIKSIEFEVSDADWNIKEMRNADKDSSKELRELQEKFHSKKSQEAKLSKQADELEQAIKRLTREHSRLKAEEEAAESIAKGYTRAVRGILEARDGRVIKGIHGTVAELANVDPKYQVALLVAAGNRMQAIVVDDDQVAANAIEYLKKNNLGRATFLPMTKMIDGRPRGKSLMASKEGLGFAVDLVKFDERYRAAFWYVFGDTVVVNNLDQARKLMGGVRLVTLDGELLEASGAMVGGNLEALQLKFGSSGARKIDEVSEQLDKAIQQSEQVAVELKTVREELLQAESKIREISGTGGASAVTLKALESKKEGMKGKLSQAKEEQQKKREELTQIESNITLLSQRIEASKRKLADLQGKRDAGRKRIEQLAPRELSQKLKALQSEVTDLSGTAYEVKSAKDTLEAKIKLAGKHHDDFIALDKELKEKLCKLQEEVKAADDKERKMRTELAGLKKIEDSMGKEMEGLRKSRDNLFKEKTTLEGEKDKVVTKIDTHTDLTVSLRTRLAQAQDKLKELTEEMKTYNVQVVPPVPSLDTLKDHIRQNEQLLDSLGAVNLKAIEDYADKKKRLDELKTETTHLGNQRKDLLKLMDDLTEKKKINLLKVYNAVNDNFKRAYAELSGGAEAELLLENGEQPFEGGLAIKAKPKNGKVLRLEALSGGEKSLTALAFIFAIQEFIPSPFYLMDEVDMFLDGINADMVARRIQKSSKTAQFLQISLRKITLTKADHIIGVTKQEGGISHVIMRPNLSDIKDFQEEFKIPDEKAEEGTT